jgi:sugar O-acyltransferase (sialic acid O-acetyltransferase NeuD family)
VGTRRTVVVYGAGGHGKVVADLVQLNTGFNLLGFLDDSVPVGAGPLGYRILGGGEWLDSNDAKGVEVVFGLGDNTVRARVSQVLSEKGVRILTAIHPAAVVAGSASIGVGTVVMANATIAPEARIGKAAVVNSGAVADQNSEVGDYAHLAPNSTLGIGARVGTGVLLGTNASVIPGKQIGDRTIVGAGAAVVRDLPPDTIAVGVPAKVIRTATLRP